MRAGILGGLLAVGLMMGCGGAVEESTPEAGSTSEAAIPCRDITGRDYVITYYSDATKTTEVGKLECGCRVPETVMTGTKTVYYQKVYGCIAM
ncbi:hypothetical protein ACLESO_02195 [Pyxidicoccus sp. 3LG]